MFPPRRAGFGKLTNFPNPVAESNRRLLCRLPIKQPLHRRMYHRYLCTDPNAHAVWVRKTRYSVVKELRASGYVSERDHHAAHGEARKGHFAFRALVGLNSIPPTQMRGVVVCRSINTEPPDLRMAGSRVVEATTIAEPKTSCT